MALPDTTRRVRYLFVAVMVGHILLISTQVSPRPGVTLLQASLVTAMAEIHRLASVAWGSVWNVWDGYVALRGVRADNQRLVQEMAALRVQVQQERAAFQTTEQLRALLGLRANVPWKMGGADVIGGGASPEFRSAVINRGTDAGFNRDMPVITATGLVGRIVVASAHAATLQLIVDRSAAAAAIVERSRVQGVIMGNGDGTLRLDYLSATADVQRGDRISTSGVDGIYPKGIVVGVVERVEKSGRVVTVVPVVDFSSLETVLVIVDASMPPEAGGPAAGQAAPGGPVKQ